ncbi:MAG: lipid-A-disaccharide synthase [Gemmatimonadetes bacterium]|nr:lipid-A-disaccharide synthase [Gemmatimonadota bacterium]
MTPRILITAGEPSGDLHAARIVAALRARMPEAVIEAVGGPLMEKAGAVLRRSIDGLAAMGLVEIIDKLPAHIRLLRMLTADFRAGRYDLLITVDYPGFHLRLAEAAKRHGVPVLWYIAPQLWAWRPQRAARLARAVDRLAVILPFEEAFFDAAGVEATYVGHPLADREAPLTRGVARQHFGLAEGARTLALFPGSRAGEISRLWPAYRDAARQLLASGACHEVLVAATEWGSYPGAEGMHLVRDDSSRILAAADAVLAKSGTTTLEAAMADVPMVVAYRVHPLTYRLAQRMITVKWVSLVNLIADREVVPELLQGEATPARLVAAIAPLLDPASAACRAQRAGLAEVRARVGGPGANARVAELAAGLLAA